MDPADLLQLIPATRGRRFVITPLTGGLTNKNFRVDVIETGSRGEPGEVEGGGGVRIEARYVLRVAGDESGCLGIDREAEVACSRAAAQAGVGPEILAYLPEHGALLRQFIEGRILQPEEVRQPEHLARLVAALRRYHDGPPGAGRFCAFATIRSYHEQARARGVAFPDSMDDALAILGRMEKAAEAARAATLAPCHNDLLAANFIAHAHKEGLSIIDWEYAGMGDRFFDLGNLSVNNEFTPVDDEQLLALYFGRATAEDLPRLQRMRLVSDLREALWGFLQAGVSRLPVDYLAYGAKHLDRFLRGAGMGTASGR
jgi:thiamine kinase-like enzyme